MTPNGLINFMSEGYGGRASDVLITKECGFIDAIPEGTEVMTDRGFKHIESLLLKKNCTLIRPASVSNTEKSTLQDVVQSRKIACLRIHVERAISRIREFGYLHAHARLRPAQVSYLDDVVNIASGLINLQSSIIL